MKFSQKPPVNHCNFLKALTDVDYFYLMITLLSQNPISISNTFKPINSNSIVLEQCIFYYGHSMCDPLDICVWDIVQDKIVDS